MEAEIRRRPLYVPSEFWDSWGRFNDKLLADYGIENFKRTVSHNYQNWMMTSPNDSQVRRLHELWPTHRSHQPWLNTMEAPDHVGSPVDPQTTRLEYPLADARKREIYRVAVGLLWEYVRSTDSFGVLDKLTELEVGNPVRIWRNGRLISSDLAHSVRERNILLSTLGLDGGEGSTVAELGAGHGRLAEIFGRTTNYRYFIFDITPALAVSQWYIKSIFPNERIFEFRHFESFSQIESELRECRFAFFTANQIELIPDDAFDLFINMNSLMEMRPDQVRNFLNQIDRLTTRAFLSRQWLKWRNPDEGHSLAKEDFALSERWRVGLDQIDDIFPEFFNQVWQRAAPTRK
jgi:putative sugar O-methyltransferase